MTKDEVEEFAGEKSLDVRPISACHYRLMDEWGKYVVDIYFKKNKRGQVVKNSIHVWKTGKWGVVNNTKELSKLTQ